MAAPQNAIEVVSLAQIKAELRLDADDTSQDDLLTQQVGAAVEFISGVIDRPILAESKVLYCPPPVAGSKAPLYIRGDSLTGISSIKYWTADGELRSEPDGTIEPADLGRFVSGHVSPNAIYPPVTGWPAALQGSCYEVNATRQFTRYAMGLPQAVILCVRQFYNGYREIRPTEAFYALIEQYRYYG